MTDEKTNIAFRKLWDELQEKYPGIEKDIYPEPTFLNLKELCIGEYISDGQLFSQEQLKKAGCPSDDDYYKTPITVTNGAFYLNEEYYRYYFGKDVDGNLCLKVEPKYKWLLSDFFDGKQVDYPNLKDD